MGNLLVEERSFDLTRLTLRFCDQSLWKYPCTHIFLFFDYL